MLLLLHPPAAATVHGAAVVVGLSWVCPTKQSLTSGPAGERDRTWLPNLRHSEPTPTVGSCANPSD